MCFNGEELPDLPGIEDENADAPSLTCSFGCIVIPLIAIICLWLWDYVIAISFAVAAVLIVGLYQWLRSCDIKIDAQGLAYRKLYRHRKILWADVEDACLIPVDGGRSSLQITDSKGVSNIPINSNRYPRTIASIWQHLRRHNKADNLVLPDYVLSMWAKIPDDIPDEMDYTVTVQSSNETTGIYRLRHDTVSYEAIHPPEKNVKGKPNKSNPVTVIWDDVIDLWWDHFEDDSYLSIIDQDEKEFVIESKKIDKNTYDIDNVRFLLAVVRRGRESLNKPVPIPTWLLTAGNIKLPDAQR